MTDIERYRVSTPEGRWLSWVYIDEELGNITFISDWGNFTASWPDVGRDEGSLKEFLLGASADYVKDKLNYWSTYPDVRTYHFYLDDTIAELKRAVIDARRPFSKRSPENRYVTDLDPEEARECWEHIEKLEGFEFRTAEAFLNEAYEGALTDKLFADPPCIPCVEDVPPRLKGFMKQVWPRFQVLLQEALGKSEFENEGEKHGTVGRS